MKRLMYVFKCRSFWLTSAAFLRMSPWTSCTLFLKVKTVKNIFFSISHNSLQRVTSPDLFVANKRSIYLGFKKHFYYCIMTTFPFLQYPYTILISDFTINKNRGVFIKFKLGLNIMEMKKCSTVIKIFIVHKRLG